MLPTHDATLTPEPPPRTKRQLSLADVGTVPLLGTVVLSAVVVWSLPKAAGDQAMLFYFTWCLLIAGQVFLRHLTRNHWGPPDTICGYARRLTLLIDEGTCVLWALFVLTLAGGKLWDVGADFLIERTLRIWGPWWGLWLPVCLFANFFSLLLAFRWRDISMVALRVVSLCAILVPLRWFLVECG